MYKILKDKEAHRLSEMFETKFRKRKCLLVQVQRLNTESECNTLNYRGTVIWNSLRIDLKNATSKGAFKKHLAKERKSIETVTFERETVAITNKDIETNIYF